MQMSSETFKKYLKIYFESSQKSVGNVCIDD
jgi:hypothetical protein